MKNSKLIDLLKGLDKDEFRRFKKFLQSPYFNSNQLVLKLYEGLYKYHPDFDAPTMTKEKLYKKIYPGEKYSDTRMRIVISDLKILTEEYLVQLQLKKKKFEKEKVLTEALSERNLFDFFEKKTKKLVEELESQPQKGIRNYMDSMWLKHNYFYHPLTNKYKPVDFEVPDILEDLDRFFVLAKLQFGSELKMRERIFSKRFPISLTEESLRESKRFSEENPVFQLYKCVFELFDSKKRQRAYETGKKLLEQHIDKIGKADQIAALLYLRNYVIGNINKGEAQFNKDLLELYKMGLEYNIIVDNNKISEGDFSNIISAGCMQKEFDWTENFIEQYERYLDKKVRIDAKILGYSMLYFHSRNFQKTIDIMGQHIFSQILYQIQAKTYLVRAWFEQFLINHDLFDLVTAQLEAFERLLRRNESLAKERKEGYLNFVLLTKQLTRQVYQKKNSPEMMRKMMKNINSYERLTVKNWLLEKVNEFMK